MDDGEADEEDQDSSSSVAIINEWLGDDSS
jgi:hypothetical protein